MQQHVSLNSVRQLLNINLAKKPLRLAIHSDWEVSEDQSEISQMLYPSNYIHGGAADVSKKGVESLSIFSHNYFVWIVNTNSFYF